ncbi:hypothetical protein NUW54_g9069 [Trametes sanguinea]|uniref:Uncharacterized protein n=1 Tax=Trametes sanguinea TaxID=158606 RepID=A0ACC1P9A4_9APHY|nr:hypothetical protein NUW54_g9069 [Trametes sanguinea]
MYSSSHTTYNVLRRLPLRNPRRDRLRTLLLHGKHGRINLRIDSAQVGAMETVRDRQRLPGRAVEVRSIRRECGLPPRVTCGRPLTRATRVAQLGRTEPARGIYVRYDLRSLVSADSGQAWPLADDYRTDRRSDQCSVLQSILAKTSAAAAIAICQIMWPCSDAACRDAGEVLREFDGYDWGGSILRVGWNIAVPIAPRPAYARGLRRNSGPLAVGIVLAGGPLPGPHRVATIVITAALASTAPGAVPAAAPILPTIPVLLDTAIASAQRQPSGRTVAIKKIAPFDQFMPCLRPSLGELIQELMETDMRRVIHTQDLSDDYAQYSIYETIRAFKALHSDVTHRDLTGKPSNLLLKADCGLKSCDFGLARSVWTAEPSGSETGLWLKTSQRPGDGTAHPRSHSPASMLRKSVNFPIVVLRVLISHGECHSPGRRHLVLVRGMRPRRDALAGVLGRVHCVASVRIPFSPEPQPTSACPRPVSATRRSSAWSGFGLRTCGSRSVVLQKEQIPGWWKKLAA